MNVGFLIGSGGEIGQMSSKSIETTKEQRSTGLPAGEGEAEPRTANRAVDDEDPSYSPMTRRGEDGRAHVVEEKRSQNLPRRLDQPVRMPGTRLPRSPD